MANEIVCVLAKTSGLYSIRNDSGDPSDSRSDSTMNKTPRVRPI